MKTAKNGFIRMVLVIGLGIFISACQASNAHKNCRNDNDELWGWYCGGKTLLTHGQVYDQPLSIVQDISGNVIISDDYASMGNEIFYGQKNTGWPHSGIDFATAQPGKLILATADGYAYQMVEATGQVAVRIQHSKKYRRTRSDGSGQFYEFVMNSDYEHMFSTNISPAGRKVQRGEVIGILGELKPGSDQIKYLHYGLTVGRIIDGHANPHLFWANGPGKLSCFDPDQEYPENQFYLTLPIACSDTAKLPPSET
ncbi:MAG: hypothetical protein HON65_03420 [Rhodospirillales bacterium]|nr:hypothetical protein [Rhodospirillales bacterium]